ncbi:MAG: hypothetical protein K0R28_3734, partial [Paenibacillus sp.]|nr:hypothetical protein [Paenibacillus sp.]
MQRRDGIGNRPYYAKGATVLTKSSRITFITAFVLLFLAELAFGYYLSVVHGYVIGDSISRVANAFYISHSRDPHLAALGFVWNPLPSLIEWFWLLFWPLYPKLASAALAGTLTTSLFAAGTFVLLLSHCRRWGISLPFAVPFCLLYALNPFLFLYGANGMSEVMFTFFLVVVVIGLCRWLEDGGSSHTVKVGFALALAFLIRYEAIPLSAAIGFAVAIAVLFIVPVGSRAERSVLQY